MQLVLDTCALVALVEGEPMRTSALAAIEAAQDAQALFVSSFVALEVAQKMAVGKLVLGKAGARTWFGHAVRRQAFAPRLPEPYGPGRSPDVAMARLLKAPVVTIDRRILATPARHAPGLLSREESSPALSPAGAQGAWRARR